MSRIHHTPWLVSLVVLIAFISLFTSSSALAFHIPLHSSAFAHPLRTPSSPPNIILIMTDDMRVGDETVMPKLNQNIIRQGASFSNFFVTSPLCCPSRSTTLRSQYPHNTGILSNNSPTGGFALFHSNGDENSTIGTWLQDAGYRTALIGKYLNGYPTGVPRKYVPTGWNEWDVASAGLPYSEYDYTLNENGKLVQYGHKPEDYGTDVYAKKALSFIKGSVKVNKPFFLYLAPYAPHVPMTPAPRDLNLFQKKKLPQSPSFNEADVSDKPTYIQSLPLIGPDQLNIMTNRYRMRLRSLQAVDDMIESLVLVLNQKGVLDNTYIFFMSDNGFHLGEHRMTNGKQTPYMEDVRVPLFVRGPGVPLLQTHTELVLNNDLAPTFAELAGASVPDWVDGRSFVGLFNNSTPNQTAWRHAALLEVGNTDGPDSLPDLESTPGQGAGTGILEPSDAEAPIQVDTHAPPFKAVLGERYVYVEYATQEHEIYDLTQDPYELSNLYSTADDSLKAALASQLSQLTQCAAATCRAAEDTPLNYPP